jgi:hypothetical protein
MFIDSFVEPCLFAQHLPQKKKNHYFNVTIHPNFNVEDKLFATIVTTPTRNRSS